jgi:glutamine---fructose-6-phosphate transaminase (isomerizing)
MCGIVGYVGARNAVEIIADGLHRLEYRGYDSAGLAVLDAAGGLHIRRAVGRIAALEQVLAERPVAGMIGIGHTRWATHGRPCEANAHPHSDCSDTLVVVHNGILENCEELRARLATEHRFRSETDTEILSHLIEHHSGRGLDLVSAVRHALADVTGSFAVAVLSRAAPDRIVVAKRGAGAAVIGVGRREAFIASDVVAVLPHTRDVLILEDDDVATVSAAGVEISRLDGSPTMRALTRLAWDPVVAEKGEYPHFMLKEIHEQPRAIAETILTRLTPDHAGIVLGDVGARRPAAIDRVIFVACGTAYHAGMIGRVMVERLAGLPAEVDLASEFRYRDAVLKPSTLVVAISQSGETADTIGAARAARARGCAVLAITNVATSTLAREAAWTFGMQAGPEIGVASTKAFSTMIAAVYLLGCWLGVRNGILMGEEIRKRLEDLLEAPTLVARTLESEGVVAVLAREMADARDVLYLGRGPQHAIALEGALKLKEISYIHAEGYAAGEMKHGPIALISEGTPVIALAPRDGSYDRMLANIEEARARGAFVIAVTHPGDQTLAAKADRVIEVPSSAELVSPLVTAIPLQLLAYHVAVARGCDVDRPRNLAKSVTVE